MQTHIQTIHFETDIKLEDFILTRMAKLNQFYDRIESSKVWLKLEKNGTEKNKVVEITLDIPGDRLFAKDQSENFEQAFGMTFDEIKKQLIMHKINALETSKLGMNRKKQGDI